MTIENDNVVEVENPYSNATQSVSEAPAPAPVSAQHAMELAILAAKILRGANWFYWIAGLSLVNLVAAATGMNFRFVIGLGISEGLAGFAQDAASRGESGILMYAGCIIITAFFAAAGWFARRPSMVAFVVGSVVFALDTLVFVMIKDWIGVAFHGWALFNLWRGIQATREFKALRS